MEETWLTYREAGERLGCTAEVVRYRALRGKWPRRRGNDGRARVQLPEDAQDVRTLGAHPVRTPSAQGVRNPVHAQLARLEGELAGMREALTEARARAEAAEAQLTAAGERETQLQADVAAERLKVAHAIGAVADLATQIERLAAERARPWWRRLSVRRPVV